MHAYRKTPLSKPPMLIEWSDDEVESLKKLLHEYISLREGNGGLATFAQTILHVVNMAEQLLYRF